MSKTNWSRRKFVYALSGAGAVLLLDPFCSFALQSDPKVAAIVAKTIGIDTHNHIDVPLIAAELPGPKSDLAGDMKKSGLSAICMTFAVDYQQLRNPGDAYDRFINGLTAMDSLLKSNGMKRSMNLAEIKAAYAAKKPTVIQSVEGAHFLEGKLDRLGIAYGRGLRHLCLLHDNDASVPLGDVFTNPPKLGGLTAFGTDVVNECERLGILVDLSHGSNDMVNAALKIAKKPVLVSHTGLDSMLGKNENMARMMRPRLISAGQAKNVANAGGVIGVWTHLSDTPLEYAQNIKALVNVAGIDHVGIGTDTKLTPSYRSPGAQGGRQAGPPSGGGNQGGEDRPQGGGQAPPPGGGNQGGGDRPQGGGQAPPPGGGNQGGGDGPPRGGQNRPRVGERTNEAWANQKEGFYYAVVDALLKTGFNEVEIGKIGGGNFLRVFDAAVKKG